MEMTNTPSTNDNKNSNHNNTNDNKNKGLLQHIPQSLKDVFAGAAAGAFAKTATAPIERVKLVMQLRGSIDSEKIMSLGSNGSSAGNAGKRKVNTTAWSVTKSIYYEEGIIAFWRGNTPNVVRQGGAAALNFMLMDWYKAAIKPIMNFSLSLPSQRPHELREKRRKILSSFLSGGLAGGTTTTFLYPVEFMRTRLALDLGTSSIVDGKPTRKYPRGMRDVFFTIWKTDGIRGLYQGYGIALSGVVIYRALHLGGFDACKTELIYRKGKLSSPTATPDKNKDKTITMWERFAIAQIVSIGAGTICYPIDSVRRRLMMQAGLPHENRRYRGSIHAFRRIWIEEGLRGFYLGIAPNLFRSVGAALLLVTYDVFKDMI